MSASSNSSSPVNSNSERLSPKQKHENEIKSLCWHLNQRYIGKYARPIGDVRPNGGGN